jgi:RimJ/RimL family protein N-acetyltransferase
VKPRHNVDVSDSGFRLDDFGDPIGLPVPAADATLPGDDPMVGRYSRLERVDPESHGEGLYRAMQRADSARIWTYMPFGPYSDIDELRVTLARLAKWVDWFGFTIFDSTGEPEGWAAYLRADLPARSIEVGGIVFSPALQRTSAATEAMYLLAKRCFESGFRRYEWKCDALNAPSRRAAQRLGFTFEGIFRQATIYKGRNRDTAWYSMIDTEWPDVKAGFERWLDPANFDDSGRQRISLEEARAVTAGGGTAN